MTPKTSRRPYAALLDAAREIADIELFYGQPVSSGFEAQASYWMATAERLQAIARGALKAGGLTNALRVRYELHQAKQQIGLMRQARDLSKLTIRSLRKQLGHVADQRDRYREQAVAERRRYIALVAYIESEPSTTDSADPVDMLLRAIHRGEPEHFASDKALLAEYRRRAEAEVDQAVDPARREG